MGTHSARIVWSAHAAAIHASQHTRTCSIKKVLLRIATMCLLCQRGPSKQATSTRIRRSLPTWSTRKRRKKRGALQQLTSIGLNSTVSSWKNINLDQAGTANPFPWWSFFPSCLDREFCPFRFYITLSAYSTKITNNLRGDQTLYRLSLSIHTTQDTLVQVSENNWLVHR